MKAKLVKILKKIPVVVLLVGAWRMRASFDYDYLRFLNHSMRSRGAGVPVGFCALTRRRAA